MTPLFQAPKKDIFELLAELPVRRYIQALRDKVQDINRVLDSAAYMDQYPGNTRPFAYSVWYNDIGLQTPRRINAQPGYWHLAPVINPAEFLLPDRQNFLVSRDGSFYWVETNVAVYVRYTETTFGEGNLFDRAMTDGGGGIAYPTLVSTAFQSGNGQAGYLTGNIVMYDKKRGRYITDGQIPIEHYAGLTAGWKQNPTPVRLDPDTEIEPRLYITQTYPGDFASVTTSDISYNTTYVRFDLNVTFKGYTVLDEANSP